MILVVSPAPPDSPTGNGVTARRWAGHLRSLGHRVRLAQEYDGGRYELLLALHARKSAEAVRRFHAGHPRAPVVIALTGTDLYPDLRTAGVDPAVLQVAARLIVLQPLGVGQLDAGLRDRAVVIVQSVPPIRRRPAVAGRFEAVVLAHLRPVKDPLLAARAAALLPAGSRVVVTHLGAAMDDALGQAAAAESAASPRYRWLGPRPRQEALAVLARSRLLIITSRHEGGANVVSEALAAGTPVLGSAIPGTVGLLGGNYPGYFPPGDAAGLAEALDAAEHDRDGYYTALRRHCSALAGMVSPARERQSWAELLAGLGLR